jgi:hypothetical protein
MSWPGIEPRPPAQEASTLEKSHLDSLFAGYSEPLLGLRWRSASGLYSTCISSWRADGWNRDMCELTPMRMRSNAVGRGAVAWLGMLQL